MENFEVIDSKEVISFIDAGNIYKNCEYLMILKEIVKGVGYGNVYAVSKAPSTFRYLTDLEDQFKAEGKDVLIGGDYSDTLFNSVTVKEIRRISSAIYKN